MGNVVIVLQSYIYNTGMIDDQCMFSSAVSKLLVISEVACYYSYHL